MCPESRIIKKQRDDKKEDKVIWMKALFLILARYAGLC